MRLYILLLSRHSWIPYNFLAFVTLPCLLRHDERCRKRERPIRLCISSADGTRQQSSAGWSGFKYLLFCLLSLPFLQKFATGSELPVGMEVEASSLAIQIPVRTALTAFNTGAKGKGKDVGSHETVSCHEHHRHCVSITSDRTRILVHLRLLKSHLNVGHMEKS